MKYKALTLHQPYAQLMAINAKRYETRSWPTNYRGPIAIHAGKNIEKLLMASGRVSTSMRAGTLETAIYTFAHHYDKVMTAFYGQRWTVDDYPLGAVVAVGKLVNVHHCEDLKLTVQERLFGLHTEGRYAWEIEYVKLLDKPFIVSGKQGLWDWEYDS
jgi:hypothetical protein